MEQSKETYLFWHGTASAKIYKKASVAIHRKIADGYSPKRWLCRIYRNKEGYRLKVPPVQSIKHKIIELYQKGSANKEDIKELAKLIPFDVETSAKHLSAKKDIRALLKRYDKVTIAQFYDEDDGKYVLDLAFDSVVDLFETNVYQLIDELKMIAEKYDISIDYSFIVSGHILSLQV